MKKIVLRNVQAVGLHHYGKRYLDLLGTYRVEQEENPHDMYAVAVMDGHRKVANLKRDSARLVYDIISVKKRYRLYI